MNYNVLTICHGNLCRSPMAGALLRDRLKGKDIRVRTAGLIADVGLPPVPEAIAALAEMDIDIRTHRSTRISRSLVAEADLVLTMTGDQTHTLHALYPFTRGKVFQIRNSDGLDIEDPYGFPLENFRSCRDALSVGVERWSSLLRNLIGLSDTSPRSEVACHEMQRGDAQ